MNKKILFVVIVILLLVITAICGTILMHNRVDDTSADNDVTSEETTAVQELDDGKEFFKVTCISEVEALVTQYGFKSEGPEYDEVILSVYEAECCGIPVQFEFVPHSNEEMTTEYIMTMSCYYVPFSEEYKNIETPKFTHNGAELKTEVDKFFKMIEQVFDVSIGNNYFIIASDGKLLPNSDAASYDQIISNNAFLEFSLRNSNGDYWNLRSEATEEGLIFLSFTNYYDSERFAENIAHVTVK